MILNSWVETNQPWRGVLARPADSRFGGHIGKKRLVGPVANAYDQSLSKSVEAYQLQPALTRT
jgi:hypothetical protein